MVSVPSAILEQGAVYLKEEYRLEKTVPQIVKEVLKIVSDFYRFEAPLKPGVKETLEWMSKQQIRMVVATSGNKELVEADFLVNLFEDNLSKEAALNAYQNIFKTATGKRICKEMFAL